MKSREKDSPIEKFERLLSTPELPALGPGPRANRESFVSLNAQMDQIFGSGQFNSDRQKKIRSLILLWHDHLDESHSISQDIRDADGSFLHGIMHRREPDYSNAKYWFHRVPGHPCFPAIAQHAATLLTDSGGPFPEIKLISSNQWDPFAFVDACEQATRSSGDSRIQRLQRVQEIEFRALLEHFCR